jgi:hypothetical protein
MQTTTGNQTETVTSTQGLGATADAYASEMEQREDEEPGSRWKLYGALAGLAMLALFALLTIGLYLLGDDSQSALERLRDIAVIYIVLMSLILVILMAAATAALIYLIMQIKNQVIPLLEELTGTVNRLRGTTEFMADEAVKPVISAAGKVAQWKAMVKIATGKGPR